MRTTSKLLLRWIGLLLCWALCSPVESQVTKSDTSKHKTVSDSSIRSLKKSNAKLDDMIKKEQAKPRKK